MDGDQPRVRPFGTAIIFEGKLYIQTGKVKPVSKQLAANPKAEVKVDVPNQTVTNLTTGHSETFDINGYKKYCLMNALDDIDFLLENTDKIEAFEDSVHGAH